MLLASVAFALIFLVAACGSNKAEIEQNLCLASFGNDFDATYELIQRGVNVNAKCVEGMTPLFVAILGSGDDYNTAAARPQIVDALIKAGADVNARATADDMTVLMFARHVGADKTIMEKLIAAGADVNAKTSKGKTADDMASNFKDEAQMRSAVFRMKVGKEYQSLLYERKKAMIREKVKSQ
jgi:ankyrin repeat protein